MFHMSFVVIDLVGPVQHYFVSVKLVSCRTSVILETLPNLRDHQQLLSSHL